MAPADIIRNLLSGRPDVASHLLAACRTQAYGAEAFGGVMACQMFARQPAPLSREPYVLATDQNLAIFDADAKGQEQAIFADLYDGHVGRLWRLGAGTTDSDAEPALAMAVDVMMSQLRAPVALSAGDHPRLDPAATAPLRQLAAAVATMNPQGDGAIVDGRAFVVRAFTQADRGAALLAVSQPGRTRQIYAAASFRFGAAGLTHSSIIFDRAPQPAPRPDLMPQPTDAA
jgi:hypothetical protein